MAAFMSFRSTFFSKHLKVDSFFIKLPSIFILGIFLFKESPKKYLTSFSLPWGEETPSLLFIIFSSLLFTPSLFKNFSLLAKHKDFDFFKATLSTLNIICIKFTYIKAHLGLHSSYETTVLKKKNHFEKFIKELDFKELSTQAKHPRVWILNKDWLNDSPRYYC